MVPNMGRKILPNSQHKIPQQIQRKRTTQNNRAINKSTTHSSLSDDMLTSESHTHTHTNNSPPSLSFSLCPHILHSSIGSQRQFPPSSDHTKGFIRFQAFSMEDEARRMRGKILLRPWHAWILLYEGSEWVSEWGWNTLGWQQHRGVLQFKKGQTRVNYT